MRVRECRQIRGMTQEDLAAAVGRSVQAISKFERGIAVPSLEALAVLADALGITAADLLREQAEADERTAFLRARVARMAIAFDAAKLEATVKVMEVLGGNHDSEPGEHTPA